VQIETLSRTGWRRSSPPRQAFLGREGCAHPEKTARPRPDRFMRSLCENVVLSTPKLLLLHAVTSAKVAFSHRLCGGYTAPHRYPPLTDIRQWRTLTPGSSWRPLSLHGKWKRSSPTRPSAGSNGSCSRPRPGRPDPWEWGTSQAPVGPARTGEAGRRSSHLLLAPVGRAHLPVVPVP